jgi:hypothetical protein
MLVFVGKSLFSLSLWVRALAEKAHHTMLAAHVTPGFACGRNCSSV